MNYDVFNILNKNHTIENDISFEYWIYNIESIIVSGKKYYKIYLFNRLFNDDKLELITFEHNGKKIDVSSFAEISKYSNMNIVGCNIETKVDDVDCSFRVVREIINNKINDKRKCVISYSLPNVPTEIDYLKEKDFNYRQNSIVFPQVSNKFWQCYCGRIHSLDSEACLCGACKKNIEKIIKFDFEENHLLDYQNKDIDFDMSKSFEDNINDYITSFNVKYGIDGNRLKERLDIEYQKKHYNSKKEKIDLRRRKQAKYIKIGIVSFAVLSLIIICLLTFAHNYYMYFKYKFLTFDQREKYMGFYSIDVFDSKNQADNAFKNHLNNLYSEGKYDEVLRVLYYDYQYSSMVDKSILSYTFLDDELENIYTDSKYEDAVMSLENKDDLPHIINVFNELGDYKDSISKLNDAKWYYIQSTSDSPNSETYRFLCDLIDINYPNAEKVFDEIYKLKAEIIINEGASSVKYNEYTYITVKISGGKPGEKAKVKAKIIFPNGQIDYDKNSYIDQYSGNKEWSFYFENGCMTGPQFSGATLEILAIDELTGNIIGSNSIRVTK